MSKHEIKRCLKIARDAIKQSERAGGNEAETRHLRIAVLALVNAIEEEHR